MAVAAAYPTSLATNQLEIVTEAGAITPSHGGMVQGHEFDLPISQKTSSNEQAQTPVTDTPPPPSNGTSAIPSTTLPAPPGQAVSPRRTTSANKPRPVSMPPQAYVPASNDRDRQHGEDGGRHGGRGDASSGTRRTSNRVLGDYTLSKTLGAGSMGKVKLAHHNISGEKVRCCCCVSWAGVVLSNLTAYCSSLSRSSHASLRRVPAVSQHPPTRRRRPSKPPRMLPKRLAHSEKRPSPCSSTIRTYAACAR